MYRNGKNVKINSKTDTLEFQIVDWRSYDYRNHQNKDDEEDAPEGHQSYYQNSSDNEKESTLSDKKYLIEIYGIDKDRNSICITVEDFTPYFFVELPPHCSPIKWKKIVQKVASSVEKWNQDGLVDNKIVDRMKFYGFRNDEKFQFARLAFRTKSAFYSFLKQFDEDITIPGVTESFSFKGKIYESNIDPMLRFMHLRNIDPAAWIKVEPTTYKNNSDKRSKCNIDVSCHWKKVFKSDETNIGKLRILAFDIECTSADGSFPKAERVGDQIIQIGSTCHEYGSTQCHFKHIVTLGKSTEVNGAIVESYGSEKEVIVAWAKFVENYDPDIITGYNIFGFDWEFIYKRAKLGMGNKKKDYSEYVLKCLSRSKEKPSTFVEKTLASSALGDNFLRYIDCPGRIPIDILKLVQREHKLDSYKLDSVAEFFLKANKIDLKPHQIFQKFVSGKPEEIGEIAEYCIRDCELCNRLIVKLEVVANNIGMANVCSVPLSYIFLRGQGIKIFSLVAKQCQKDGYLIEVVKADEKDDIGYEGAIVFTPEPGIYMDPITILDYNSLYPSSMISENLSHDTEVTDEKYLNLPDYNYNKITYDIFEGKGDDKKKIGVETSIFVEKKNGEKGVLPRILINLLKARKETRSKIAFKKLIFKPENQFVKENPKIFSENSMPFQIIGEINSGDDGKFITKINDKSQACYQVFGKDKNNYMIPVEELESSNDFHNEFEKAVLEGLQLAYKITANSLYGQTGAISSKIRRKSIASATTATGRSLVILARDKITEHFQGTKTVYGDSVTGDTPLLVKSKGGLMQVCSIESLAKIDKWTPYEEFKPMDSNRKEKQQSLVDYQIWTSNGWSKIRRVIRHKTQKKIYRINTRIGLVDVTEDHSLLDHNLVPIKPKDCVVGQMLYHGFPELSDDKENVIEKYWKWNYLDNKYLEYIEKVIFTEKVEAQKMYLGLMLRFGHLYRFGIESLGENKFKFVRYNISDDISNEKSDAKSNDTSLNYFQKIIGIEYVREVGENEFVYDLETETGNFHAGIGQIIVKNTDSVFLNFVPYIESKYGKTLTEQEKLEKCLELGLAAQDYMSKFLKYPHKCAYEKIFWPFIILNKKRYAGNKYTFDMKKFKQTSTGIVLKRRDNAPIVKEIYGGIIIKILNERDKEGAKTFFKEKVSKLLSGKIDIANLIISKSLSGSYANPTTIAHKMLADRMGERDAGNKPQSSERVPFCYIDAMELQCEKCHKKKLNKANCKCIKCMKLFCSAHLSNHRDMCQIICRFCRKKSTGVSSDIKQCLTCRGWYCPNDMIKHKIRKDKKGVQHNDKCKKELPTKLLQGDIIENPDYIKEHNIKIDYRYYLDHQIIVPCLQILELMMPDPMSLVRAVIRIDDNKKNGNQSIEKWLMAGKQTIDETEDIDEYTSHNTINDAPKINDQAIIKIIDDIEEIDDEKEYCQYDSDEVGNGGGTGDEGEEDE